MSIAEQVALALPAGRSLGGVTTWTLELAGRLARERPVRLLEHATNRPDLVVDDGPPPNGVSRSLLTGLAPPNDVTVCEDDVMAFADHYADGSPQVFVPNWSWGTYAAACAATARDGGRSKIVSFVHADGPDYYDWATYYESAITRFVAVSEQIRTELVDRLPHRSDDVIVLPYPVDADENPPDRQLRDGPIRIVYAGRVAVVQKRILDLVDVARHLAAARVDAEFRIIGGGPDEHTLADALDAIDPHGTVRIHREPAVPATSMGEVWRSADVCLLTSAYEGTSIAMLEAMASGAVPVVTAVSGTDALIDDGISGLRAPVGDTNRLAAHIASLATDRTRLGEMSRAAHQTIAARGGTTRYDSTLRRLLDDVSAAPDRVLDRTTPLLPGRHHAHLADVPAALRGDHHAAKRIAYRLGASTWTRPLLQLRPYLEHRRSN